MIATSHARRGRARGTISFLGSALSSAVILAVGAVLVGAVVVPRIVGATPYTILTGSMRPDFPPGTLVIAKPVEESDVRAGDVVTYQLKPGEPTVVTHRVIAQGVTTTGATIFHTQGDANNTPDEKWVLGAQLRGRLWYSIPYLGHVSNAVTSSQRETAALAVAGLLVGYAGLMFVGSIRDRRSTNRPRKDAAS
jgi:signal peptidase